MVLQALLEDQAYSPRLIAAALGTTETEIAGTLGLGKDAIASTSGIRAGKIQVRLREMLEILIRIEPDTGSPVAAYTWFRSQPLPGFGGVTPVLLLREGNVDQVHAYLERVMAGGFA